MSKISDEKIKNIKEYLVEKYIFLTREEYKKLPMVEKKTYFFYRDEMFEDFLTSNKFPEKYVGKQDFYRIVSSIAYIHKTSSNTFAIAKEIKQHSLNLHDISSINFSQYQELLKKKKKDLSKLELLKMKKYRFDCQIISFFAGDIDDDLEFHLWYLFLKPKGEYKFRNLYYEKLARELQVEGVEVIFPDK